MHANQAQESKIFHTGCYKKIDGRTYDEMSECLKEIQFDENIGDDDCPYTCAGDFLQGVCQLFSLALHQEFGYDAFEIRKGSSCHFFCRTTYEGIPVYIDVRGATTNWDEFLSGTYSDFHKCDKLMPQNIEEDAKLSAPYAKEGFDFAKHLISEHPKYYNISLWGIEMDGSAGINE